MKDIARRLVAEALGTAFLVATVVGSGIMASRLTEDTALALLGNTLPTGAILVVLIISIGIGISWSSTYMSVRKYLRIKTDLLYT